MAVVVIQLYIGKLLIRGIKDRTSLMCSWPFHNVVLDNVAIFLYLLVFETYEHLIYLGFFLLDGLEEGVDQLLVGLWLLLLLEILDG